MISVVPLEVITISRNYRKRPTTTEVNAMAGQHVKFLAPAANHKNPCTEYTADRANFALTLSGSPFAPPGRLSFWQHYNFAARHEEGNEKWRL